MHAFLSCYNDRIIRDLKNIGTGQRSILIRVLLIFYFILFRILVIIYAINSLFLHSNCIGILILYIYTVYILYTIIHIYFMIF